MNLLLLKDYVKEVEGFTARKIPRKQKEFLKNAIRKKEYKRLNLNESKKNRREFNQKRLRLITEWEFQTNQSWPRELNKDGKYRLYDAHHIIENCYGGDNEWWNLHPARFPDQHQKQIHGKDSTSRKIFK